MILGPWISTQIIEANNQIYNTSEVALLLRNHLTIRGQMMMYPSKIHNFKLLYDGSQLQN